MIKICNTKRNDLAISNKPYELILIEDDKTLNAPCDKSVTWFSGGEGSCHITNQIVDTNAHNDVYEPLLIPSGGLI